ncbi:MAG: hypothetical protein ACXAC2_25450, partial [Candidatus Kariarchaeaceae archaeon]
MTDESNRFEGATREAVDFLQSVDMPHYYDFSLPFQFKERMFHLIGQKKSIDYKKVVNFLEKRSTPLKFEYKGYDNPGVELKVVDKIKGIF